MPNQGGVYDAVEMFDDGLVELLEGESFVMSWEVLRSCIGKPRGKLLTSSKFFMVRGLWTSTGSVCSIACGTNSHVRSHPR